MSRLIDRALAVLLMIGAGVGHTAGSIMKYHDVVLLWALCGSALAVLVGALNLLRSYRATDRALAWITLAGTLSWLGASIAFGMLIGRPLDPRVLANVIMTVGLGFFSLRRALSART